MAAASATSATKGWTSERSQDTLDHVWRDRRHVERACNHHGDPAAYPGVHDRVVGDADQQFHQRRALDDTARPWASQPRQAEACHASPRRGDHGRSRRGRESQSRPYIRPPGVRRLTAAFGLRSLRTLLKNLQKLLSGHSPGLSLLARRKVRRRRNTLNFSTEVFNGVPDQVRPISHTQFVKTCQPSLQQQLGQGRLVVICDGPQHVKRPQDRRRLDVSSFQLTLEPVGDTRGHVRRHRRGGGRLLPAAKGRGREGDGFSPGKDEVDAARFPLKRLLDGLLRERPGPARLFADVSQALGAEAGKFGDLLPEEAKL